MKTQNEIDKEINAKKFEEELRKFFDSHCDKIPVVTIIEIGFTNLTNICLGLDKKLGTNLLQDNISKIIDYYINVKVGMHIEALENNNKNTN